MTRPDAGTALLEALSGGSEPVVLVKVLCRECKRMVGRGVHTAHGPLWLGYLRNQLARGVHDGESVMPVWLDAGNVLTGECRCMVPTGATQPGWPTTSNRSFRLYGDDLLAAINSRKRVVTL